MGFDNRRILYEKIESIRQRPLLVYVTSKRSGAEASMATDALPFLIDQLDQIPTTTKAVDFLISSLGGDPMVAWRIVSLLRERLDDITVLVPHSAYSAATLLALGANQIVMHPNGNLGPVDMQISTFADGRPRNFSTEDIGAFVEFVKEELLITDQKHLRKLFEATCREAGALGVGFTARSSKLAIALGEKLLKMKNPAGGEDTTARILVEKLTRQFHSHNYPIGRKEALSMELSVNKERDTALEGLMWEIWLDLEKELKEREPFSPMIELMNSPAAAELISPIPQLTVPANAPAPTMWQTDLGTMMGATKQVPPIDFEFTTAILESRRLADTCLTRGKILSCRLPDLNIQYNQIVSFRGWQRVYQ